MHGAVAPQFYFNSDPATTEVVTLSLHDALPILPCTVPFSIPYVQARLATSICPTAPKASFGTTPPSIRCLGTFVRSTSARDRKSTRLNSSHSQISYAVFCLKKKKHIHAHLPGPS